MIRIGPSGNSDSFYATGRKHTVEEPAWLHTLGLNAFEYSFGRGVSLSDPTAEKIRLEAEKYDVEFSAHAPYYTNFANPDDDMIEKSIGYVAATVRAVRKMGGHRAVVHPGALGKAERAEAMARAMETFARLASYLDREGFTDYLVCIETLGKIRQFGRVEEVIELCKLHPNFYPCYDFGHINCYTGGALRGYDDYKRIIDQTGEALGAEKTSHMHIHFSKIEYGAGGEVRHLTFADTVFGPEYAPLAGVIDEYGLEPFIVCESAGTMADDALIMKKMHKNV